MESGSVGPAASSKNSAAFPSAPFTLSGKALAHPSSQAPGKTDPFNLPLGPLRFAGLPYGCWPSLPAFSSFAGIRSLRRKVPLCWRWPIPRLPTGWASPQVMPRASPGRDCLGKPTDGKGTGIFPGGSFHETLAHSAGCGSWSVSVFGGSPRKLMDAAALGAVSPDGTQIAFVRGDLVSGKSSSLLTTDRLRGALAWACDGRLILFPSANSRPTRTTPIFGPSKSTGMAINLGVGPSASPAVPAAKCAPVFLPTANV